MSDLVPAFVQDYPIGAGLLVGWAVYTLAWVLSGDGSFFANVLALVVAAWVGWLFASLTWTAEEPRGKGS